LKARRSCLDHIAGIVRTQRLGTDIFDTTRLNHRTHGPPAITPVPGAPVEQHDARAVFADNFMRNGCAFERNLHQILLRVLDSLAECIRDFARFSQPETDSAVAVADNYKSRKFEDTTAFDVLETR
jgi:hypothetical protein